MPCHSRPRHRLKPDAPGLRDWFASAGFRLAAAISLLLAAPSCLDAAEEVLPGTQPLVLQGNFPAQMLSGIDTFFMRELEQSISQRSSRWQRDFSSAKAYEDSVSQNRDRLRRMIGAVDVRLPVAALEPVATAGQKSKVAETESYTIEAVRWRVFEGVYGEGLWLRPKGHVVATVVAVPDADQTPEMASGLAPGLDPERQFARRLVENGCEVLVPVLIDREDTWSGNAALGRFTNQPHREWIYREAFQLGRHIIGYEVQKVLAGVDFFKSRASESGHGIGVVGYGEGGLIAFHAAALDTRIKAALVSGYFDSRQRIWEEPVYRNVFGLLQEFGDAEIASLVAPRSLIVEHSPLPNVTGPPPSGPGRAGAAPGKLVTPDFETVEMEFERAQGLITTAGKEQFARFNLVDGPEGITTGPVSDRALVAFLNELGAKVQEIAQPGQPPVDARTAFDPAPRMQRQFQQLHEHTQKLFRKSEQARADFFWSKLKGVSTNDWAAAVAPYKKLLWEDVIGRLPPANVPANPRTRKIMEQPKWTGYEVVLDVFPDVFAWGYLLVPNDLAPGQRRPVVVCQHGRGGLPASVIDADPASRDFQAYKAFAARLADRGFVVFAPHNPYRGEEAFRQLQRKANPVGKSLFSVIIAQHERALDWLSGLAFVDSRRIGLYGLSYGGKTAMRVPPVLDRYTLSICSGDFNEWIAKTVSVDFAGSYMFTEEYEMCEWNIGNTFNYAEMAALIAPRPFMVERGHLDTVALDEWVEREYEKVRRVYKDLGVPERTAIEFFDGPHTINGIGTFDFLHKHLDWPAPAR